MSQIMLISFGFVLLFGCETNKSPLQPELYVYPLRISYKGVVKQHEKVRAKFTASNYSNRSFWFWGYSANVPLYTTQVKGDTGWINAGLGWCGTGTYLVEMKSNSVFDFTVWIKPDRAWRVGISFYDQAGEFMFTSWSNAIRI